MRWKAKAAADSFYTEKVFDGYDVVESRDV